MCGIVGLYTAETNKGFLKKKDIFKELLYLDALRGLDSTGVIGHNSKGSLWAKKALHANDFIQTRMFNRFLEEANTFKVLIGHNRAATRGNVTDMNAHPFIHDHIIGVHNGTISSFGALQKHNSTSAVVDSDKLIGLLSKGIDLQEIIDEICGSYTLVWINENDHTLNFLRNEDRPMYYAQLDDDVFGKNARAFASEPWMISGACTRNGAYLKDKTHITSLNPYVHLKINTEDGSTTHTTYKEKPKSTVSYGYTFGNHHHHHQQRNKSNTNLTVVNNNNSNTNRRSLPQTQQKTIAFVANEINPQQYSQNKTYFNLFGYMLHDPWDEVIVYGIHTNFIELIKYLEENMASCCFLQGSSVNVRPKDTDNSVDQHIIRTDTLSIVLIDGEDTLTITPAEKGGINFSGSEKLKAEIMSVVSLLEKDIEVDTKEEEEEWKNSDGYKMTPNEIKLIKNKGCVMCGDPINSPKDFLWANNSNNTAICTNCWDHGDLFEYVH